MNEHLKHIKKDIELELKSYTPSIQNINSINCFGDLAYHYKKTKESKDALLLVSERQYTIIDNVLKKSRTSNTPTSYGSFSNKKAIDLGFTTIMVDGFNFHISKFKDFKIKTNINYYLKPI